MKKLQEMTAGERKKRIAQLVKNPGTRSKVPAKYLPAQYRSQRDLNTRLNAPVVEGSTVTQRDLTHQRDAASSLKYGTAQTDLARGMAAAQQQQKDTGGWYDQYKAELAQHQANTAQIGAQEQAQMQQFGGAVQGLDQSQLNQTTQASVADAAARGTVPGAQAAVDMTNAAGVRQALLGSLGGMMAGQAGDANRYADTLSHVVAPGQKLQGMATAQGRVRQAGQKQTDLAKEKGAFEQQFEEDFKQNEAKNVLAGQIAGVKSKQEQEKIDLAGKALGAGTAAKKATLTETGKARRSRERIAADRNALSDSQFQAKYGQSKAQQKEKERHDRAMEANAGKTKAGDPATVDAKAFYAKYGIKPVGTAKVESARNSVQTTSAYVNELKSSGNDRKTVANMLLQGVTAPTDDGQGHKGKKKYPKANPLWLTVALDQAYLGGISAGTANKLHRAGYSVATLGLSQAKPKPKPPATSRPAAGLVPGVGRN